MKQLTEIKNHCLNPVVSPSNLNLFIIRFLREFFPLVDLFCCRWLVFFSGYIFADICFGQLLYYYNQFSFNIHILWNIPYSRPSCWMFFLILSGINWGSLNYDLHFIRKPLGFFNFYSSEYFHLLPRIYFLIMFSHRVLFLMFNLLYRENFNRTFI